MNKNKALEVMLTEKCCVKRQEGINKCDRRCSECDLCLPIEEVLQAYDFVIDLLTTKKERRRMNNDLISREALKKAFEAWKNMDDYYHDTDCDDIPLSEAYDLIDNAPTVELDESIIQEVLNKRCMTAVANEYLIALHGNNGRQQGEWIKQYNKSYELKTNEGILVGEFTKCPKCQYDKARGSNYCPNCGAKMGKVGAEE